MQVTRRQILAGGALAAMGWAGRSSLAQATFTAPGEKQRNNVLVNLFLRGGADGLNVVVPYAEDAYHKMRPNLRIASPKDNAARVADRALDLDGFFGFHPALAALVPFYHSGALEVVHAVGSGDQTRSHFEAMATMERGLAKDTDGLTSGWIARHLLATGDEGKTPLRAVALTSVIPDALRGATQATTMTTIADYRLSHPGVPGLESMPEDLQKLYAGGKDAISHAGRETLEVLKTLGKIDPNQYRPGGGAVYPTSELGQAFKQVAMLTRAGVGLEVAFLDRGGFDSHYAQGSAGGYLAYALEDVGKSLAAFATDMGQEMDHVTVVVQTEFGRRAFENISLGTDHGRASMMMLLGGGVKGGRVVSEWPGLDKHKLEDENDLRVTTDYRDVLSEVLAKRLGNEHLNEVFTGRTPKFRELIKA